jgi:hypothetical protein
VAIYCFPSASKRPRVDEIGFDMRVTNGPVMAPPGDFSGGCFLYFWAFQIDFYDNSDVGVGGGHIGLQAYNHPDITYKGMINWGVYDDTIGGGATFRSGPMLTDDVFVDINAGVSFGYTWFYNHWYRFRVYKSPKQDYVANEIYDGSGQIAPYVGTDQQTDEVAFRCTVQDVTAGSVPFDFHDVLVKSPATSKPMALNSFFTEPFQDAGYGGNIFTEWPWSPEWHVRHINMDGIGNSIGSFQIDYSVGTANCNITAVSATPGYMRQKGGETRTNAALSVLTTPTGFFDAAPANVTPDIHDTATRIATPRPWY